MGLLLSVVLGKEKLKLYAGGGRRSVRGRVGEAAAAANGGGGGGCEYGRILGGDVLLGLVEEKPPPAVASPACMGVKSRGASGEVSAVVSGSGGGTPARPIWQRRVLMGVRCQLPRFSGMILYDESGRPVCSGIRGDRSARDQEKHAAAISVLRDLL